MDFKPVDTIQNRPVPQSFNELVQQISPREKQIIEHYPNFPKFMDHYISEGGLALGLPIEETSNSFWRIFSTLISTGELVKTIQNRRIPGTSIAVNIESLYGFEEGIFDFELVGGADGINFRLLEIGFLQNPEGVVMIKRSQRHRLGLAYRRAARLAGFGISKEKERADKWLDIMKKQTGFQPELFGLLVAAFSLIPHSKADYMLICDRENHPSIKSRREDIQNIKNHGVYTGADYNAEEKTTSLRAEIERILPLVDFKAMLNSMGVTTTPGPDGYHQVTLRALENGVQRSWGDDAGFDRLPYRKILYGALRSA